MDELFQSSAIFLTEKPWVDIVVIIPFFKIHL